MAENRSDLRDSFTEYRRDPGQPPELIPRLAPRPAPPAKLPPYSFFSSRSVCSMYEIGSFRLDGDDAIELTDELVDAFTREMTNMETVAAFVAATADNQPYAAALLKRTGFLITATWPGNACVRVSLWMKIRRKEKER